MLVAEREQGSRPSPTTPVASSVRAAGLRLYGSQRADDCFCVRVGMLGYECVRAFRLSYVSLLDVMTGVSAREFEPLRAGLAQSVSRRTGA